MQERPVYDEDEIDLVEYAEVLVRRKWLILAGTIAAVLLVYISAGMNRSPSRYEAQATLLITRPVYKTELSPETFAVDVYSALAGAQDLKQLIIDSLQLIGPGGDPLRVTALDAALSTEIAAKSPGSSLLHLKVETADSSRLPPVAIANAWAELFTQKNSGISSSETVGSFEFIQEQHDLSKAKLLSSEEAAQAFSERYRTELMEVELSNFRVKLENYTKTVFERKSDLKATRASFLTILQQTREEESSEGEWLGLTEADFADRDLASDAGRLVALRDALRVSEAEVRRFESEHDVGLTQTILARKEQQVADYVEQVSALEVSAQTIDAALEKNIWKDGGRPGLLDAPASASDQTFREILSLRAGYNVFGPRVVLLRKKIRSLRLEIDSLQTLGEERAQMSRPLAQRKQILAAQYAARYELYQTQKGQVNSLGETIQRLEADVAFYGTEAVRLKRDYSIQAAELERLKMKRGLLDREVETARNTYGKFAKLLEDARVAKAHRSGDLKVVARAIEMTVTEPAGVRNRLILALGGGLVLSILLAFFMEFLSRAKERMRGRETSGVGG